MMDPAACLTQLARMLAEETSLLGQLEQQLSREHDLLVANDADGLEQAANARQACIAALARLDQDRRALCRMLGHGADQQGLSTLLRWCDSAGTLATSHAAAARQAQKCRDQNDRNGALVNARLNRLNGLLGMLDGNKAGQGTYAAGRPARSTVAPPAGRMLSISA